MLGGIDLYKVETNFEEAMRVRVVRKETRQQLDRMLYREATKRVRFTYTPTLYLLLGLVRKVTQPLRPVSYQSFHELYAVGLWE